MYYRRKRQHRSQNAFVKPDKSMFASVVGAWRAMLPINCSLPSVQRPTGLSQISSPMLAWPSRSSTLRPHPHTSSNWDVGRKALGHRGLGRCTA